MSNQMFDAMLGNWTGVCRTWFEADVLSDESSVAGEFTRVFEGPFLRHVYHGTIRGKPRNGEELLAWDPSTGRVQCSWIDDFHMSQAIMFSEGEAIDGGFRVVGTYDVGEGQPRWGWRTDFAMLDKNHLTITAYNVSPEGCEAKAVETVYERVTPT